jgi:hypothetical protein
MSQPQDRAVKRLVTFIQSVQFRLRSGLLNTKHSKRINREERGRAFVNEQVNAAKGGHYVGSEAFNQLRPWETRQFSFITPLSSPLSPPKHVYTNTIEKSIDENKSSILRNTRLPSQELDESPQTPALLPFSPTSAQKHLTVNVNPKETKVPQLTRSCSASLQLMELMGFSRIHRRLYLLIDGSRSIDELARLIGRTSQEVSELLSDLKDAYLF